MPKIVFRGKTYNSVFEMPNEIREAYQIEKRKQPGNNAVKSLTDVVEIPDEIKELYERAMGNVDTKSASSRPLSEFPKSEDIFRRSAPSEDSMYTPSEIPNPPSQGAIEEDNGPRRLIVTLAVLILLAGMAAFYLLQA